MLTQHRFDVLIVGMGPAGIAAACAAAESGRRVGVVDDNPREGGQIWRGEANRWIARFQASRLEILRETRVVDSPMEGVLAAVSGDTPIGLRYETLIMA